jgi:hypothetical protein
MKSEHSSPGIAWAPEGSNPKVTAVLVPWDLALRGSLQRKEYRDLMEDRLRRELARLGESEARSLLEDLARSRSELLPLLSLNLVWWPRFLVRECPSLAHGLWGEARWDLGWPSPLPKADNPSARRALEKVGLRKWLTTLMPSPVES